MALTRLDQASEVFSPAIAPGELFFGSGDFEPAGEERR